MRSEETTDDIDELKIDSSLNETSREVSHLTDPILLQNSFLIPLKSWC